jgi:four helix bundle protein
MATITNFEDFEAFKKARELLNAVYAATRLPKFSKDFGLVDQIRRAAVSVVSNFAEGFERDGKAEFIQFLSQAKGSVGEIKAQLLVSLDQGYLTKEEHDRLRELANTTARLLGGLMAYLRQSDFKGTKFMRTGTRNPKPGTRNPEPGT